MNGALKLMLPAAATIKPTHKAIQTYYQTLKSYADLNQTHETGVRTAFIRLLEDTAKQQSWTLVTEVGQKVEGRTIRPDATLYKSAVPRGYYEAKDTKDDLDTEIRKKTAKNYPLSNIIFEDTRQAVLYQNKHEVYRVTDLKDPSQLAHLLSTFYSYTEPVLDNYDQALAQFKEQVPRLAGGLVTLIETAHKTDKTFTATFDAFFELCKTALNPNISRAAVDEMLVQHLLTERLIRKIFDNPEFTKRNAIATEIEKVIASLVSHSFSREEFLKSLDTFYQAIEQAAHGLDFQQKQGLLNEVYERFFQGYSKDLADTHGIVYTPQPIVDFMCASVVEVLQTEFGKSLGDDDVVILDPATGTGNFIVNLLRRVPKRDLAATYQHRLFANEIMLLPYYIAALNIEHAYYDLTGQYESFEGLCFVDTLELAEGTQMSFSFMNEKNTERVERQKNAPITVIIGNPPYNVGQANENDNNKNRKYGVIDQRIKETYAKDSKATSKSKLNDPYVKFFRWAVDRLQDRDGIVCMVTNNSFFDQIAFDGMRKHLLQDFTQIYHVDLHGNVRQNPKLSGTTHNVFGIQVGVGITVAVRSTQHVEHKLYYHRVPEDWRKEEKLGWLAGLVKDGGRLTPPPNPLPASDEGESEQASVSGAEKSEADRVRRGWATEGDLWEKLRPLVRQMRTEPTEAEKHLWQALRKRQQGAVKFRRQHAFDRFIVDFYCHAAQLVIEVDGSIHDYTPVEDQVRQAYLESLGLRVIRFTNHQVLNDTQWVLDQINAAVSDSPSSLAGRGLGGGVNPMPTDTFWQPLTPDNRQTWRVPGNSDEFATFLPIGSKVAKESDSQDAEVIFKTYSLGVTTARDEQVYDFDRSELINRVQQLIEDYNAEVDRYKHADRVSNVDNFVRYDRIKWSETLKLNLKRGRYAKFDQDHIRNSIWRPYCQKHLYYDAILNERPREFASIFPSLETEQENRVIWVKVGSDWPMFALMSNHIVDLLPQGGSQCFPFYVYDPDPDSPHRLRGGVG
ncbi:MAG: type ISP restriction/modification enzyme, partial [Chloroflexota bacterium]